MMRSLFSGISGLRNHQTRMDVIGNNIANVNTVGFKSSRVNFQDMLNQTIQGASSGQGNLGGTNPIQVGLGMGLASIDTLFTDGSTQPTGKQTDLAISGSGFFVLSDGMNQIYTRAGNFDFDNQGNYLVPGSGYKVMGWAGVGGNIDTNQPVEPIKIPVGSSMAAKPSTSITYGNNLSGDDTTPIGSTVPASIDVYDSLGIAHSIDQIFYKVGTNTWLVGASADGSSSPTNRLKEIVFTSSGEVSSIKDATMNATSKDISLTGLVLGNTAGAVSSFTTTVRDEGMRSHDLTMEFTQTSGTTWSLAVKENGKVLTTQNINSIDSDTNITINGTTFNFEWNGGAPIASGAAFVPPTSINVPSIAYTAGGVSSPMVIMPTSGAVAMNISVNLNSLTQYGGESTVQAVDRDGYAAGTLEQTTIDGTGTIIGKFSNGQTQKLAQVCLATFNNPAGLTKVGDNMYIKSNNSGEAQVGVSGTGGRGGFNPGSLEMSNVDLAQEFSNMIITQRGFQANSKIITVTDEMLQDLTNLKR